MEAELLRYVAKQDQLWANIRVHAAAIERIGDDGPSPGDSGLVQGLCRLVALELALRDAQSEADQG